MSEVHVCLVSDQLLANLIPALVRQPRKAHLMVSTEKVEKGQRLAQLLTATGVEVTWYDQVPDADFTRIFEYARRVSASIKAEHSTELILVNVTGGNKLMAFGFLVAFRSAGAEIIYLDTAHNRLEIIGESNSLEPVPNVLDVKTYLAAQGFHYESAESEDAGWKDRCLQRREVTEFLGRHAGQLLLLFRGLNQIIWRWSQNAVSDSSDPTHAFRYRPLGRLSEAIKLLSEYELLQWDGDRRIQVDMEKHGDYLSGRWLEEYAWLCARDCGFADVQSGVRGYWRSGKHGPVSNEFDVLAIHDNRMLLIECKTARLDGRGRAIVGQDLVTKIESLGRNASGLFGTTLLVAARDVEPSVAARCQAWNIALRAADDLAHLRDDLQTWKETGQFLT